MTAKSKHFPVICRSEQGDVINPRDYERARDPGRTPKKESYFTKAKDWFEGKSSADAGRIGPQRTSNGPNYASYPPSHQSGGGARMTLPPVSRPEDPRNQPASSSHGDRNGSREADGYQIRAPPPGSYQDDDTGPSPKNLVMAVMGVKSAVNHFAKALILDMTKYPEELKHLKQTIRHEVQAEVDRANHWKFLVQAFVCKRLFEGFGTENGFFGIEYFDNWKMSSFNSFADFSKFKDKAATISALLAQNSADVSFLGKFCFKKFKSISGDFATNHAFSIYQEDWSMVERERHPQSDFYQSFLKVAVSVWLLHRLVYSFEQGWKMLGWETYPKGSHFQRKIMESVVPGGYEEEDEDTDVNIVVGFLVIPGFQVSKSVVKCEVYLRNKNSHPDLKIMEATEMTPSDKTLEKTLSDKSPASFQTPEKAFSNMSPVSFQTSDSFKSSSNHRDAADKFWDSRRESLGNVSGRRRTNQDRSPKNRSGHAESKDRAETRHFLTAPATSSAKQQPRPPGYVTRHTALSKRREEMNRHSGW